MNNNTDTAIIFYSKEGNTRIGAKIVNEKLDGKLIELMETRKGNVFQALFKRGSKLKGSPWLEVANAKSIYLMFPIWAGNCVPAMNTFIKNYNFNNKTVCIMTFQADRNLKGSQRLFDYLKKQIKLKNGTVNKTFAFVGGGMKQCLKKEEIQAQLNNVNFVL